LQEKSLNFAEPSGTMHEKTMRRGSAFSELTFCSCGYFAKEVFINLLIAHSCRHASQIYENCPGSE